MYFKRSALDPPPPFWLVYHTTVFYLKTTSSACVGVIISCYIGSFRLMVLPGSVDGGSEKDPFSVFPLYNNIYSLRLIMFPVKFSFFLKR